MKSIKFVSYLFYRCYSNASGNDGAYLSVLAAMSVLLYIHLFQLLIIFDSVGLIPISKGDDKLLQFFKVALVFLPIFLLVRFFVRKSDLQSMNFSDEKVKRGNWCLIMYIFVSFALLILLMIYRRGRG